jgi:rfaE bifunctional protein kinase chain/domain/rfaE bifunctional protein nucleotidyltransferase chain/domain
MTYSKILSLPALLEKLDRSKKAIMACGCFDIVHPGHIRHLTYAKSKADILVVSVTADRHIKKGIYRPHVPEQIRAESLAALEMVDYVIIDENADHLINVAEIKPDYFAKGFEYSDQHHPATVAEIKLVESYGGQMIFTPGDVVYSSTKLLNTHLPKLHIEKLINLMKRFDITFEGLRDAISNFQNYKCHVVGDTIIDTYTRTNLIGSNAKTPTFSVLYDGHEDYIGGAAIVSRHLKAAGADVTFTTVVGNDRYGAMVRKMEGIKVNAIVDENRPTTHKNTIIAGDSRLLKVDTVDNAPISSRIAAEIANDIKESAADCTVFSDFRHGIFSKATIHDLAISIPEGVFTVADSQVASRWGNITEFKGFDLITPNEKEARFALADQDSNIGNLATLTQETARAENIILKLGARGVFFLENGLPYSIDSFASHIRDAVGAGDALLAYATLTMLATKSLPMACIIGSMAAACECEYDGNIPVRPEDVLRKLAQYE